MQNVLWFWCTWIQLYLVITTYGEGIRTLQYLTFIETCGTVVTFLLDWNYEPLNI